MAVYYKSRFMRDPIVYVQHDGEWRSYGPGGVIGEHSDGIPGTILAQTEEITEDEAKELISLRLVEAERGESEREVLAREYRGHAVGEDFPFPLLFP